jgi:hypothetical protein
MITNDEAVELLDYIAMNDLENAYDAERDAISADMYDNCDPSEFSDTRTIRRRASLLTNSPWALSLIKRAASVSLIMFCI